MTNGLGWMKTHLVAFASPQMDFRAQNRIHPEDPQPGVEPVPNPNVEALSGEHEKAFALHLL